MNNSELEHAKALHVAATFLPNECPLQDHVFRSYKKHHLESKIQKAKQLKE